MARQPNGDIMVTNNSANYQPTQYNAQTGGASGTLNNVAPSAVSGVPVISQGSSAQPAFGTAVVAGGGTGLNTLTTAYGVVCAGTTATGALQNAGAGSAGQILTSNGASALPSFQAAAAGGFSTVVMQTFTTTGTYTPTANMKYCVVECIGGGGAGGGAAATSPNVSVGSGGGAGAYGRAVFSAATIGASKAVTIGAAGTGASGTTGNAGGSTSLGTLIVMGGGAGGLTSSSVGVGAAQASGGLGGTPTTTPGSEAFSSPGGAGFSAFGGVTLAILVGGAGANSLYGAGGVGNVTAFSGGAAALGYGSGGAGALNYTSGSALSGGAGTAGIVIVTEYIQ